MNDLFITRWFNFGAVLQTPMVCFVALLLLHRQTFLKDVGEASFALADFHLFKFTEA